jgi:hypothetical protein
VAMGPRGFRWQKLRQLVYDTYGPICHIQPVITRSLAVSVVVKLTTLYLYANGQS